ncbi:MAG: hypothetical protein KME31_35195 [Tolypothrix carrinoi HA7290-LM1]|jgi:siroheme synthase|nr:hypothetical protein [Tolypothrix carrinoi HA7290-LM1]
MKHIISIGINQFIEIEYTPGGSGFITSTGLKGDDPSAVSEGTAEALAAYNGVIDGLESLILARACEGIDITTRGPLRGLFVFSWSQKKVEFPFSNSFETGNFS